MASASKLTLQGLDELRRALRALPEELTQEASVIVQAHAEDAQRMIQSAYPEGPTGNLRRGVTREQTISRVKTRGVVRSRAPHAHLFERGSKTRHTKKGWNRGAMPEAKENQRMIPIAIRARRRMVHALVDLVRRAGFQVTENV